MFEQRASRLFAMRRPHMTRSQEPLVNRTKYSLSHVLTEAVKKRVMRVELTTFSLEGRRVRILSHWKTKML
jgi:hypothetical protein